MGYEVIILGDNPFNKSEFSGEEYILMYDTNEEALKDTFTGALNCLGIEYDKLSTSIQEQLLEDTYYDFVYNNTSFNITVNEE